MLARRGTNLVGLIAIALAVCAAAIAGCGDPRGISHPLARTTPEDGPAMVFDAGQPFGFELGRGSGWHGLETIAIEPSGATRMYRGHDVEWETTTLALDAQALAAIGRAVVDEKFVDMERAYHADVQDGTQWAVVLTQGEQSKCVYFNNHFPDAIVRLSKVVDREVQRCGAGKLMWESVPLELAGKHDSGIWKKIR